MDADREKESRGLQKRRRMGEGMKGEDLGLRKRWSHGDRRERERKGNQKKFYVCSIQ